MGIAAVVALIFALVRIPVSGRYAVLNYYPWADVILFAGGDYIAPIYGFGYVLRAFEMRLATLFRKPTVLYAQSIGPFSGIGRSIVSWGLSSVNLILARDTDSYDFVRGLGISTDHVKLTADSALLLKSDKSSEAHRKLKPSIKTAKSKKVAIVLRSSKYTEIEQGYHQEYLSKIATVVTFIHRSGFNPVFLATNAEDEQMIRTFMKHHNFLMYPLICAMDYSPVQMMSELKTFHIIISSRLHLLILSTLCGVPAYGVGREFKLQNYLQLIGLSEYYSDMRNIDTKGIITRISAMLKRRTEIAATMNRHLKVLIKKSSLNMQYVTALTKK
jgi:colanic acid/amylovoran biosynthesis protein